MVEMSELDEFVNATNVKKGDIIKPTHEGTIEEQETQYGRKKIFTMPVLVNGTKKMLWSPGKMAQSEFIKLTGSSDSKGWVNKEFVIDFVKTSVRGEIKNVVIPGSIRDVIHSEVIKV